MIFNREPSLIVAHMDIQDLYKLYLSTKRVSTDTRQVSGGEMFFALKGPNFDGNAYAKDALNKGSEGSNN